MKSIIAFKIFVIVSLLIVGSAQAKNKWFDPKEVVCVLPTEINYTKTQVHIKVLSDGHQPMEFTAFEPELVKDFIGKMHTAMQTGTPLCESVGYFLNN